MISKRVDVLQSGFNKTFKVWMANIERIASQKIAHFVYVFHMCKTIDFGCSFFEKVRLNFSQMYFFFFCQIHLIERMLSDKTYKQ